MSNETDCHIHVVTGLGENEHPLFSEEIFTKFAQNLKAIHVLILNIHLVIYRSDSNDISLSNK